MKPAGEDAAARAVLAEPNARLAEGFTEDELQVVARWLAQAAALEQDLPQD